MSTTTAPIREWYTSRYARSTELYVETTQQPGADGMPRSEYRMLAIVTPSGYQWRASIWQADDKPRIELPSHWAKETAMQSVIDYFKQHEQAPELL